MTIDPPSAFRPGQPTYLDIQRAVEAAMDFGWGVAVHPGTLASGSMRLRRERPWPWRMRHDCDLALTLLHHPLSTEVFDLLASGRGGAA